MTVDTRDILLKAAEDVQSGMWCYGGLFVDEAGTDLLSVWPFDDLDVALLHRRCAMGSIYLAAAMIGGDVRDGYKAVEAVEKHIPDGCRELAKHNDFHLPKDSYEAGQQLAELFRTTAESL